MDYPVKKHLVGYSWPTSLVLHMEKTETYSLSLFSLLRFVQNCKENYVAIGAIESCAMDEIVNTK